MLAGVVQGVGFRPFVYRQAKSGGLHGWVRNVSGRVEIHVQGNPRALEAFTRTLIGSAPELSRPVLESVHAAACIDTEEFLIHPSLADAEADIHLPADLFTCDDCLDELSDPENRRYRYPFINCTQCGPRYTLIKALPYDRPNTSMAGFPLCTDCRAEYGDPLDRRYHAEPVGCANCGPALSYTAAGNESIHGNEAALEAALAALRAGKVLAVKGIGGYHLVCDAGNDDAVALLRKRKPRPHKPLAVMFPSPRGDALAVLGRFLQADAIESGLLESAVRPIVLLKKWPGNTLSGAIAPGLNEVGAMLPYSPLHHVLLKDFGAPLVASSANISGEPVLTDNEEAEKRLAHVADAFLHHDRAIVRPADDPVVRVINRRPAPLRQGRGLAPQEIELAFRLDKPVLAVGAHMKNTIALGWDRRVVVSPHIGEMDSPRSLQTFERCIADLARLYQVDIEQLVCDAHPRYTTSRWAKAHSLPALEVFHHHAHASAVYAEALAHDGSLEEMLVFTWDGVGLGPDGSLWGGEALAGKPGQWRRVGTFRAFRLPGGENAGREPWRSAAGACWEAGLACPLEDAADPLLASFWRQGKNAPPTTAAGRLFDAAAALTGVCKRASFEGQGPMLLEALAAAHVSLDQDPPPLLTLTKTGDLYSADWSALIPMLVNGSAPAAERALKFHLAMADTLLRQAMRLREDLGLKRVGLSGGVFQNRLLTEKCIELLELNGFAVTFPTMLPVNDAGISFGQIVEYGFRSG